MTQLGVADLHVSLGGKPVLRGVTLDLAPGALTGLVGPNGAGKSTLLKAMAGLVAPARGRVSLDGEDIAHMPPRPRARRIAYLPQGHALHWPLSARDVVALGRLPHGGAQNDAAVTRAMQRTGAAAFAARSIATLSGGEQSRVMLARALAVEAPVLLADEPVASLDPYHQLFVMALLRELAREGQLIVAVLHDLALAARFCGRLVLMQEGRMIAAGAPDTVLTGDNLARAYGVEALHGSHRDEAFVLAWRRIADGL